MLSRRHTNNAFVRGIEHATAMSNDGLSSPQKSTKEIRLISSKTLQQDKSLAAEGLLARVYNHIGP
jgi:hypothetical protein